MSKELWVKNNTGLDVGLGDLGMKVPAGSTVDIYKRSHYITPEIVKASLDSGSLYKRISANKLEIVQGRANSTPHALNHLKASKNPVQVVKSKSSVLVDTAELDVLEDGDLGGIADYGFDELGPSPTANVTYVKDESGAVVVRQHQDEPEPETSDAEVSVEVMRSAGIGEQIIRVVVKKADELIEEQDKSNKVYVITPPEDEPEPEVKTPTALKAGKTEAGVVVMEGKTTGGRNLKVVSELNKVADAAGISVEELPQEVINTADADAVVNHSVPEEFDTKVATKTETGAVVMKLKQVK